MMIGPLVRALFAVIAAVLSSGLVRAEEGQVWLSKSNGSLVTLAYGPVDPAKPPFFLLSCFNGMDVAVLDLHQEIAGAKPGDKVGIEISAGSATASLEGETSHDEVSGLTVAEASDIKVKPVLAVLSEKGQVTVKVGTTSTSLGEQGRADAVGNFAIDCKLD